MYCTFDAPMSNFLAIVPPPTLLRYIPFHCSFIESCLVLPVVILHCLYMMNGKGNGFSHLESVYEFSLVPKSFRVTIRHSQDFQCQRVEGEQNISRVRGLFVVITSYFVCSLPTRIILTRTSHNRAHQNKIRFSAC